jgi:excisionase family DNA binding protein
MLLSISEAAKLLGVCDNTLRDWDESGKFRAVRTEGGHRRYSLEQIREYLEENQKVETKPEEIAEVDKFVVKWKHMLTDVYGEVDTRSLAILLDNASLYIDSQAGDFAHENLYCKGDYLQLVKDSWIKTRFRKMVTIQPMTGPCGLIYFMDGNAVRSEAVAAIATAYNFKVFNDGCHISELKKLYSDTIATEIDNLIFEMLPRISMETLQDALATPTFTMEPLKNYYDYIIGPKTLINELRKSSIAESIALYETATVLDPDSFLPRVAAGKYPAKLTLPIFSPYLLVVLGATCTNGTRSCILRAGSYTKEHGSASGRK